MILRCLVSTRCDTYRIDHYMAFVHIKHNLNILIMLMRMLTTVCIFVPIMALTYHYNVFVDTPWWTTVFLLGGGDIANLVLIID